MKAAGRRKPRDRGVVLALAFMQIRELCISWLGREEKRGNVVM